MIGPKVKELIIMLTGQCIRENGWKTNSMERELRVGLTVQNILELTSVGRRKASEISNGLIMPLMKESLKITTSKGKAVTFGLMEENITACG